jgi:hypothetical protein
MAKTGAAKINERQRWRRELAITKTETHRHKAGYLNENILSG